MLSFFSLLFKISWLTKVVSGVLGGVFLSKKMFEFIKEQIKGSEYEEKFTPFLTKLIAFLEAVWNVLSILANILNIKNINPEQLLEKNKDIVYSFSEATNKLDEITKNLNQLTINNK